MIVSSSERRKKSGHRPEPSSSEMEWASKDLDTDGRGYRPDPTWSESDNEEQSLTLSESSVRLLMTSAFSLTLSNTERQRLEKPSPSQLVRDTLPPPGHNLQDLRYARGQEHGHRVGQDPGICLDPVGPYALDEEGTQ